MAKIKIAVKAENIGIHSSLSKEIESASCKLGFYANNGSGKTFLSRAFAIYENAKAAKPVSHDVNRLLSFGQNKGSFEFRVEGIDPQSSAETLKISLNRESGITVDSSSKYIFHVFNSDYVRKNLEERRYSPDGNIQGVILGKENIDVAKEEEELAKKEKEKSSIEESIKADIDAARRRLTDERVRTTTQEYAQVTFENVIVEQLGIADETSVEKFDVLVSQLRKIEKMPDDLPDVSKTVIPEFEAFFDDIKNILTTKHSPAEFAEEFKALMRERNDFIRSGLKFSTDTTCPFCDQELNSDAEKLIDQYRAFLENAEAKVIEDCKLYRKLAAAQKIKVQQAYDEWTKQRAQFEEIKSYLPSSSNLTLSTFDDASTVIKAFDKLDKYLSQKESNVSLQFNESDVKSSISSIHGYYSQLKERSSSNESYIDELNKRKHDLNGQKLAIKKNLCIAKLKELREPNSKKRARFKTLGDEIHKLAAKIQEKRNQNKRSKKQEVSKSLKELLSLFFGDKYSFDEEKFCLTFSDSRLTANADDVLSDGEKGIVAFCHYMATTHQLVDSDDDYKNLFFIIDDPISSMDFHFVYKVADCVRRLGSIFPSIGEKSIRYLILTHNLEFISILDRNNICNHTFALRNGQLIRNDCSSALPYEPHLLDIVKISNGDEEPTHTTANSIRHTLETIGKFLSPGASFENYFKGIKKFESDPYLWSLINDQSHGAMRDQPSYVVDDIRKSCSLVVEHVEELFPNQVSSIKERIKAPVK